MTHKDRVEAVKEMIQREIQSIDALTERTVFKELMEGVFLNLYETNLQMYEALEKRVQDELGYDQSRYRIKTGVVEKAYYDESHHFLSPIEETDLEEMHYEMGEIIQTIKEGGAYPLMKVMLSCDYLELEKFWEKNPVFYGVIRTEGQHKEWEIEVRLQRNTAYLKKIEELYHLFIKNGVPWQTVNAPYLYKMADVMVTKISGDPDGTEKIEEVSIQFGEYSRIVKKELVPVWNIQKLVLDGIGFPTPCEDHVSYEHNISLHEYGSEHSYLAEDSQNIQSVIQTKDRLRIISAAGEAKKWDIYMLRSLKEHRIDRFTYPLMPNGRAESFAEKYQRKWNQNIRTRTELAHFIRGFGLEEYVRYQDCEIREHFSGVRETYSMNPFIEDEVRMPGAQKKLVLYFKKGEKEPWLQRDILSFLTSEVQRIYPEYECGGVLS